jgi:hypothetical protein
MPRRSAPRSTTPLSTRPHAFGVWLGGLALSGGVGMTAPTWVAVALTVSRPVIFAIAGAPATWC